VPLNLRARFLRMRARVPMYRLFLKIFLWFWTAAVGILAIVSLATSVVGPKQIVAPNMFATVASILASESVKAYELGGPEAFARFSQGGGTDPDRQLLLLDGAYKDVLSRSLTDEGLRVAHAAKSGQLVVLRGRIAAYRYVSPSGRPYTLLFFIKTGLRQKADTVFGQGLPFGILVILLATLLCFWLAYHIASPIYSIQNTARKVAEGDLKARVPASVSRRYDELAALGKDFDSMVGRLDLLIQTQKNLLNSVSHELRSPLARINLSIALLKRRYSADSDDLLQRLERDVTRIDLLMGQLLTLSRLEAGLCGLVPAHRGSCRRRRLRSACIGEICRHGCNGSNHHRECRPTRPEKCMREHYPQCGPLHPSGNQCASYVKAQRQHFCAAGVSLHLRPRPRSS